MRIGLNPNKDKIIKPDGFFHQVIIPVYIPNEEGYFKDSFQIFKYNISSLLKTCHNKTFITIINNGSCNKVHDFLEKLYTENKIHELIHTVNIGKLNAILKGVVGQNFKLVTISDADVIFLNNWQKETYKVFAHFPRTGAVCTTPSSKSFNNKTFNIIFEKLFSKDLKFSQVKNRQALESFANSIGNSNFYNNVHLEKYLTISNGDFKAVVGAGHFVTTYRFDIFNNINKLYTDLSLGGNSEVDLLDSPVIKKGLWRLSTEDNFTYHMGNVIEPWMDDVLRKIKKSKVNAKDDFKFRQIKESKFVIWLKNIIFEKFLNRKKVKQQFLQYKGLTKKESIDY